MGSSDVEGPSAAADEWVVLLDAERRPIGAQLKSEVHHADTPLHLAFSVHVIDDDGNTLLTRRALTKRTWPGVWSNACCGHPAPGEFLIEAVGRRLVSELGLVAQAASLALPDFAYRARDAGGVVENEICPVFLAQVAGHRPSPKADPGEVAEWMWLPRANATALADQYPRLLSPWSVLQYAQLEARGPANPTTPCESAWMAR